MKVICAWCGKIIKKGKPGDIVSHGMCEKCKKEFGKNDKK